MWKFVSVGRVILADPIRADGVIWEGPTWDYPRRADPMITFVQILSGMVW